MLITNSGALIRVRQHILLVGMMGLSTRTAHVHGQIVDRERPGAGLYAADGRTFGLVTGPEHNPLMHLHGAMVEVWGVRSMGRLVVQDWKVTSGPHGMSAWVGVIEQRGIQLGMTDRNSGAYYFFEFGEGVDAGTVIGKPVLVEGYVDGPHRVRVMSHRILEK